MISSPFLFKLCDFNRKFNDFTETLDSIQNSYKIDFEEKIEIIKNEYRNQVAEIKNEYSKVIDEKINLIFDKNKIKK